MHKKIYNIIFLLFIIYFFSCNRNNQNNNLISLNIKLPKNIDSLKTILTTTQIDTLKLKILEEIYIIEKNDSLKYALNDSIINFSLKIFKTTKYPQIIKKYLAKSYFRKADKLFDINEYSESKEYLNKSIKIFKELNYKKEIATSYNLLGLIFYFQSQYNDAIECYEKCLKILEELNDKGGIAYSYNNIGEIFRNLGNYSKAIEYYNKSLKVCEIINEKEGMAMSLNNLGLIYYYQEDYTKALEYYTKSLKLYEEIKYKKGIAISYNNIGTIYDEMKNYSKAIEYYTKSLKIKEELNNKQGIAMTLNNIGHIYCTNGDCKKAIKYFKEALKISEEIESKERITANLNGLGKSYFQLNNINKAIYYGNKAYKIAKEIGSVKDIKNSADLLDKIYYKIENYKLSYKYYREFILMRDSIQGEEAQKMAQRKYYQYKYERKATADSIAHAKEMKIKNLEIAKQKNEARKNKIIASISIAGIIVVFAFLIFVYRSLQITRQQKRIIEEQKQIVDAKNIELAHQNDEITRQRDEIIKQRDEIQTQRDLIQNQKEEIEYIHNELKSSINYAQRIQEAVLPSREAGKSIKRPHFIMFKPKDVVSGDFYWYTEIGDTEVYAVADCTGHGVPGGFMSMLGIALLNEIVRKKEIMQANQILNELRKEIITALKQRGVEGEQKDGMDISLLVIENDKGVCQWSGANNPMYIVSKNLQIENIKSIIENQKSKLESFKIISSKNGYSLLVLEPDPMPVAIHPMMYEFTNNTFPLLKDSYFYLFSDGFADQFGGERNKKYGYKRLRELLLSIADENIEEQCKIIEREFEQWKGTNEQIDDVTIIVIRV